MMRSVLLLLFFFLAINLPKSQQRLPGKSWKIRYQQAEQLYNSPAASAKTDSIALSLYKQVISLLGSAKTTDSFLFDAYLKAGILNMSIGRNAEALQFFNETSHIQARSGFLPDTLLFKPYLYSGSVYYDLNNLDSAFWFYKNAENLLNQHPLISESRRLYNKLGVLYFETGDYRKSIPYFTRALFGLNAKDPKDAYFVVNYRNNIASALRKLGYTDSAIAIYKELLPSGINKKELTHNIGVALLDEGKNAEALFYLKKAGYRNQAGYNHLAQALLGLNRRGDAAKELDKAYQVYREKGRPAYNYEYANSVRISGDLAMAEKNYPSALRFYQRAIMQLKPDFKDSAVTSNPVSFRNLSNSFTLFDLLLAKARAFEYIPGQGARNAFQTLEAALILAKQLELRYHSDEARLFLNGKVTPTVQAFADLGIKLAGGKEDAVITDKIFRWCEGNKAAVLQAGLYALQMDSLSGLPEALLQRDKRGKTLLAKLELQAGQETDSTNRAGTEKKIADLEIGLAGIQEKLEELPAYRELEFASRQTGFDSIRKHLAGPDEAILSFYYTQKNLICFFVTKEENGVRFLPLEDSLVPKINSYRNELNAGIAADRQLLNELSIYLFDQLIRPVFEKIKAKKHLVIIPCNAFSYIPFESLTNTQSGKILLENFAISYSYSANFLKKQQQPAYRPYAVLGFAPFCFGQGAVSLPTLPASKKEIEAVRGNMVLGGRATKKRFVSLVAGYPVIHLATHAKANDTDPLQSYIEFTRKCMPQIQHTAFTNPKYIT